MAPEPFTEPFTEPLATFPPSFHVKAWLEDRKVSPGKYLPCTGLSFIVRMVFNPHNQDVIEVSQDHFTDEGTEAQRSQDTCSRSYSREGTETLGPFPSLQEASWNYIHTLQQDAGSLPQLVPCAFFGVV